MNRLSDIWLLHRRAALIAAALLGALLVVVAATAVIVRASGGQRGRATSSKTPRIPAPTATPTVEATPSDVQDWNAVAPVAPRTSPAYPAIALRERRDPATYTRDFATELFTRDYKHDRSALLAWVQYEDSPLQSPRYPAEDWSKVLVDSLTDLTWDGASDTPVPTAGSWLALRSQRATEAVTNVRVSLDQLWEQAIADGRQGPDPLATVRDVSFTLVRRSVISKRTTVKKFDVSIAIQLGTSPQGGYGVAATNNYVIKEVA